MHPTASNLKRLTVLTIFLLLIVTALIGNSMVIYKIVLENLSTILAAPSASYDQKMQWQWGFVWNYMGFIQQKTPPQAVIAQPDQTLPWLSAEGNIFLMRGFLFPRQLVYGVPGRIGETDIDYMMIAKGTYVNGDKRSYGWPKFPVLMKNVFYLPRGKDVYVKNNFSEILQEEEFKADREVKAHQKVRYENDPVEYLQVSYSSSLFDWWMAKVDISLVPNDNYQVEVLTNNEFNVSPVAKVQFTNNRTVTFSGQPNKKKGSWEILTVDNLYQKAFNLALKEGWPTTGMKAVSVGLDLGYLSSKPYIYDWGLVELERGKEESVNEAGKLPEGRVKYLLLGNYYFAKGDYEKAAIEYKYVLVTGEEDPWVYYLLAEVYRRQGDKFEFRSAVEKAVSLEPNEPWSHFLKGEDLKDNSPQDAVEEFTKALFLDPQTPWAMQALAQIYEGNGWKSLAYYYYKSAGAGFEPLVWETDAHKKSAVLKQWAKTVLDGKPPVTLDLADAYYIDGDKEKAKEIYEEMMKLNPRDERLLETREGLQF